MSVIASHANAYRDGDVDTSHHDRRGDSVVHSGDYPCGSLRVAQQAIVEHGPYELVAADAPEHCSCIADRSQPVGGDAQDVVAGKVWWTSALCCSSTKLRHYSLVPNAVVTVSSLKCNASSSGRVGVEIPPVSLLWLWGPRVAPASLRPVHLAVSFG